MNVYKIIKSSLEFNKDNFEKWFLTTGNIQEKIINTGSEFLEKHSLFPAESKEAVTQWASAVKNSMQVVELVTVKNYEEIENYLSIKK